MNVKIVSPAEFDSLLASQERQRRITERQNALRQAWRTGKGPQLSLADKLAALKRIEEQQL